MKNKKLKVFGLMISLLLSVSNLRSSEYDPILGQELMQQYRLSNKQILAVYWHAVNSAKKDKIAFFNINHFEDAFLKVALGSLDNDQIFTSTLQEEIAAHHEAAHAFSFINYEKNVGILFSTSIKLRLFSDCINEGICILIRSQQPKDLRYIEYLNEMQGKVVTCLCGGVAEQVFGLPDPIVFQTEEAGLADLRLRKHLLSDLEKVDNLVSQIVKIKISISKDSSIPLGFTEEELKLNIVLDCYRKSIVLITKNHDKITEIAQLLLDKKTVSGQEIYHLCGVKMPLLR